MGNLLELMLWALLCVLVTLVVVMLGSGLPISAGKFTTTGGLVW